MREVLSFVEPVPSTTAGIGSDWKQGLPVLTGRRVQLRELEDLGCRLAAGDAGRTRSVTFHLAPTDHRGGFRAVHSVGPSGRAAGRYVCFAVVPEGMDSPVGLFQVRALEPAFATAEWGFALGAPFWGTGVFMDAARLTVEFALETMGVHRLEARAAVVNGRGNGALAKIGAVREAVLRQSFLRNGEYVDQALWSIVREDWRQAKAVWGSIIH